MLQRYSPQIRPLIDKATAARDRAQQAKNPEDRQFWLEMETNWLTLVSNVQHVERTSDFLMHQESLLKALQRPSGQ